MRAKTLLEWELPRVYTTLRQQEQRISFVYSVMALEVSTLVILIFVFTAHVVPPSNRLLQEQTLFVPVSRLRLQFLIHVVAALTPGATEKAEIQSPFLQQQRIGYLQ